MQFGIAIYDALGMPNESYDPKLSAAGFMDLACAIQQYINTDDARKIIQTMPKVQRDAVYRFIEAAKNYVDVVEGRVSG